ncbi:MAG: thiol:disulfide interchange protein DsbA/DsbL [Gammaproteobacteria bacterium]
MLVHARVWLTGILLLLAMPLWAAGYDEGIEYKSVSPRVANHIDDGKTEVVEMFWYGCSHCFAFEPNLHEWLKTKPANVNFVRVPAVFNPRWGLHARAYYTAEVLGVLDKTHQALFDAMHLKKQKMESSDELASFFAAHGVSKEKFIETFNSFAVDAKVRRATDLTQRYAIDGVPTLIVNGKYRTSGSMAGSREKMLLVVDHLIKQEAKD